MRRGRQRRSARGAGPRTKKFDPAPLPRPPRGLPQAPHRGFGAELKLVRGWNLTLWSGVGAPPRALCELHSGPHVKKIVLRLRSKKAEISKRLWPRNRKNGKRIYSYYGLQTRYAVWRSRSHYTAWSALNNLLRNSHQRKITNLYARNSFYVEVGSKHRLYT